VPPAKDSWDDPLEQPVPCRDERCVAYNLPRPLYDEGVKLSEIELEGVQLQAVEPSADLAPDDAGPAAAEASQAADPAVESRPCPRQLMILALRGLGDLEKRHADYLFRRLNCIVTEYNPLSLALLGCNQASVPIGTAEQASASVHYMCKYITKDTFEAKQSLSIVYGALQHVINFPSTAEDTGTTHRTALHAWQRLINKVHQVQEYSTQLVGLALVGGAAEVRSADTKVFFLQHHRSPYHRRRLQRDPQTGSADSVG
jgi:hypothetical protein